MNQLLTLIAIIILGLGIVWILKKGFNEVVRGLESIDDRLKRLEEKSNNEQNKI